MGRWGDGEMGRWGDGEMGRWGDREMGRWGDWEIGGRESCTFDRNLVLVNVLVLPIDLRGNPTYRTILSRIRAVTVQAYAHPQVPFNQLLPDLPFPEPDARNPLAHFLLAYHGFSLKPLAFPNLEMESLKYPIKTSRYELGLHLWENTKTHLSSTSAEHGGLSGTFFYGSARFDSVMVEQIISKFQQVLQQMIAQPDACLSEK
ncbi:MAG: hypothetical protein F6K55_15575 [Moorea sp. SIO4A3]|nr:hypothetical protein [Moorena sp. SIO4A3]